LGPPLAPGDMGEREPVARALRSGGDQAEAGPVVEPAVDEGQLAFVDLIAFLPVSFALFWTRFTGNIRSLASGEDEGHVRVSS
jgi:hypothetical protein